MLTLKALVLSFAVVLAIVVTTTTTTRVAEAAVSLPVYRALHATRKVTQHSNVDFGTQASFLRGPVALLQDTTASWKSLNKKALFVDFSALASSSPSAAPTVEGEALTAKELLSTASLSGLFLILPATNDNKKSDNKDANTLGDVCSQKWSSRFLRDVESYLQSKPVSFPVYVIPVSAATAANVTQILTDVGDAEPENTVFSAQVDENTAVVQKLTLSRAHALIDPAGSAKTNNKNKKQKAKKASKDAAAAAAGGSTSSRLVVLTQLDQLGMVPGFSHAFGERSDRYSAVVAAEAYRVLGKAVQSISTNTTTATPFSRAVEFVFTAGGGGGAMGYPSTRHWLAEGLEAQQLDDIDLVVNVEHVAVGAEQTDLFLHSSTGDGGVGGNKKKAKKQTQKRGKGKKNRRGADDEDDEEDEDDSDDNEAASEDITGHFFAALETAAKSSPGAKVSHIAKPIDVTSHEIKWAHELFAYRHVPAVTFSRLRATGGTSSSSSSSSSPQLLRTGFCGASSSSEGQQLKHVVSAIELLSRSIASLMVGKDANVDAKKKVDDVVRKVIEAEYGTVQQKAAPGAARIAAWGSNFFSSTTDSNNNNKLAHELVDSSSSSDAQIFTSIDSRFHATFVSQGLAHALRQHLRAVTGAHDGNDKLRAVNVYSSTHAVGPQDKKGEKQQLPYLPTDLTFHGPFATVLTINRQRPELFEINVTVLVVAYVYAAVRFWARLSHAEFMQLLTASVSRKSQ